MAEAHGSPCWIVAIGCFCGGIQSWPGIVGAVVRRSMTMIAGESLCKQGLDEGGFSAGKSPDGSESEKS